MTAVASAPITPTIPILTGPTATGKTAIALELAARFPEVELINADSLLVYRHLDIGTAKPTRAELARVPHHLIDIREPDEPFTAGDFARAAQVAIADITARGGKPVFVGGTGFYLKALLHGMWEAPASDPALRAELERLDTPALYERLRAGDPERAAAIGPGDRYRLVRALEILQLTGKRPSELQAASAADPRYAVFILDRPAEELDARIALRTEQMLAGGLIEEVRAVAARYPAARPLASVGYAQTCAYLEGRRPAGRKIPEGLTGLRAEITLATRQLVKRQRTWFRSQVASARWIILERERAALLAELAGILSGKPGAKGVK